MTSTEQARRKCDEIADRYEEIFFYVADVGQRLITFADPAPGCRVLNVGAGRGAVARAALARGCAVTAIDASPRMMERLGSDYPSITTLVMDAASLDFSPRLVRPGHRRFRGTGPARPRRCSRRAAPRPGAGWHRGAVPGDPITRPARLHDLSAEFFGGGRSSDNAGPLAHGQLDALLIGAGFLDVATEPVAMPLPIADPPALWDWLAPRASATPCTADFHRRFLAEAERMHDAGGITLDFAATLHRATRGPSRA